MQVVAELDSAPGIRGDAVALEQMFTSLLLNAAQASPAGSTATLNVAQVEATISVSLRDHGPGMTVEQLARVGKPLRSSKPGGTGLGLVIATRIAAAHGGALRLESPEDGGVIARVILPVAH